MPIASGANILAVKRLIGHQTASMALDQYGRLFSDDFTKVAQGLDTAALAALKRIAVRLRYAVRGLSVLKPLYLRFLGALGGIRTHTGRVLSPFPLPVGIRGLGSLPP